MLSFRVSLALRAKPLFHKLNFVRPQTFRTTPARNPNRINQFHTLENCASATHAKPTTSTLFEKQPGVYPSTPPSGIFLRIECDFQCFTASETGNATAHPPAHAQSPTQRATPSCATSTHKTSRRSMPESHTANSGTPCS